MNFNHAAAVIRWRDQLDKLTLAIDDQPAATISTMLFGCNRWIDRNDAHAPEMVRITAIKAELECWLADRGLKFNG